MNTQDERPREEETSETKYERPELTVWGPVTQITGVGYTNSGTDILTGSVNPPGHSEEAWGD